MPKTAPVPCTKEEIEKIIACASENDFYYTLFMVAKTTGRRLGEYYSVKVEDIDFEKRVMMTIVLKRRAYVKKEAILTDEISILLRQFINRNKLHIGDYVFRKVSYRQIQSAIVKYSKKAEISHKVSFHNFRHYFITELVRKGWSYDQISKLTGHASPATLVFYDSAIASDIREKAEDALKDL